MCLTASVSEVKGVVITVSVQTGLATSHARRFAVLPTACRGSSITTEALTIGLEHDCIRPHLSLQTDGVCGTTAPAVVISVAVGLGGGIGVAARLRGELGEHVYITTGSHVTRARVPAFDVEGRG